MGSEWIAMPLEDAMESIIDYRGKTPKKTTFGIPLITAKIVKGGRILPPQEFIAEEDYDTWMQRGIPNKGDVLITVEAPLGEVAQLGDEKIALAQRLIALRGRKGLLESDYLKFLLLSHHVQHQLDGRSSGTTVKGIKQSELRKVILNFPPLPEQKAIAHVLGSLDDKIELNLRMNETLEGIDQALFKSWFVDFDPVIDNALIAGQEIPEPLRERAETRRKVIDEGKANREMAKEFPDKFQLDEDLGWIPEGWLVKNLDSVVTITKGKSYKSSELQDSDTALVTLKSFKRGGGYRLDGLKSYVGGYKPEQVVQSGDLIIAYTDVTQAADVIGKPALVAPTAQFEKLVISLDVAVLRPKIKHLKFYLYGMAMDERFDVSMRAHTTGTTVLHLAKNAIPEFSYVFPSEDILIKYEELVSLNYEKTFNNIDESKNLTKLRDTLLPKLISGELRIPDAEKMVEEALS